MGNIEKLVVLTVLFLSAIVLAVSLNDGGEAKAAGSTPLTAAQERLREEAPAQAPATEPGSKVLLDAGAHPASRDLAPRTDPPAPGANGANGADGRRPLLRSREGLVPVAGMEDYLIYTVAEDGATWAELCERFYGSREHVRLLHTANEDLDELHAGDRILVPIYDLEAEGSERAPARPVRPPAGELAHGAAATKPASAAKSYVVKDGDSLWTISKAVYGTGAKWKDLYEANQDVLASPDDVPVGTKLKVP